MTHPDPLSSVPTMALPVVRIEGSSMLVPAPLLEAFSKAATISGPELCAVLPMDPETLRRHCRAGNITYVRMGFGDRRGFTLEAVLRFLATRSVTERPAERRGQRRRGVVPAEPEGGNAFAALRTRLTADGRLKGPAPVEQNAFAARLEKKIAEGRWK